MNLNLDESLQSLLNQRYTLQSQLGKRSGRRTFLAHDLQAEEPVVIKVLSLGRNFQWQDLKLFEREAKTLQTLSHPAIPRYVDYFEIDQLDFKGFALVQSYVANKPLDAHLKAGRTFTETEVKEIAKALLNILIYLQQQSPPIIHRDIKPSNILLGDALDEIYLVDFGSVQQLATKEGSTITVVGTYGYMPIEQFGGQTTAASDLYSLAATLIYLVTGRHPADLSDRNSRIQFRSVVHLSSDFANWLEWLTEPAVDRRPTSAQAALQALKDPAFIRPVIPSSKYSLAVQRPRASDHISCIKTARFFRATLPSQGALGWILTVLFAGGLAFASSYWYGWWSDQITGSYLYGGKFIGDGVLDVDVIVFTGSTIFFGGFFVALLLLAALRRWFCRIQLQVDRQCIRLTHIFFGLKVQQRHYSITQTPFSAFSIALAQISIEQRKNCKHWLLKRKMGMTDTEAEWLAYEIATWCQSSD